MKNLNYNNKREIPQFKYHPNPINNGIIEKENITCDVCGEDVEYAYVGVNVNIK
ncbi:CbrC family protein, partial [Vallitalea sediminicola]